MTQPSEHAAEVRAALHAIVSDPQLGARVLSDRVLMAGVVKDYLPDAPRETGILLAAVEHGVADTLRGRVAQGMDASTAISLTASWFANVTLFAPEACKWAVAEIALALGLGTPAEPRPQPQRQPTADVATDVTVGPTQPRQDQPRKGTVPTRPKRGRRTLALVVAGVVALIAAGVGAWALLRPKPLQPTPVVSIAAGSPTVVAGDVVVAYHDGRFADATVSGDLSRTSGGEVARLTAQQFPFKSRPVVVASRSLSASSQRVTFGVTPSLATRYRIGVFSSSSASTPLAMSAPRTVYVTTTLFVNWGYAQAGCYTLACTHGNQCSRPECYVNYLVRIYVSPSAIKTETTKHLYHYFALNLSPNSNPTAPKTLYLSPGVTATGAKLIAPNEYEQVVSTQFHVGNEGYSFNYAFCTRDTFSVDGIGLPGHHGCGDSSVPASRLYLG